jgi:hypothetical protein
VAARTKATRARDKHASFDAIGDRRPFLICVVSGMSFLLLHDFVVTVYLYSGRVTSSNIVQYILLENVLAKLMIKMGIDCAVVGQSMVRKLRAQREYRTYGRKYFDIGIISKESLQF